MKNEIKHVNLDLYSYKLENGLNVYIVPKKDANNKYVTLTTKYGSSILSFIPNGKDDYINIPAGTAHFLEHKVFASADDIDPFTIFSANGADCNANTSNYKTTYLFSGPTNFKKNLNYLLDFVFSPYFTLENVNKEKGIIAEEIKMYDDMPFWKIYDKTLENIFVNHPLKQSVAGRVSDISCITPEILYDTYNTFYNPTNMFLTITGNIDPKKVIDIVKNNQAKKTFKKANKIITKTIDEVDNVYKEKEIIKADVAISKLAYAIKINIKDYDINQINLYLNTIFDITFGATSILDLELKDKHLITDTIEYETILADKHIVFMFLVETNEPNSLIKIFDEKLKDIKVEKEDLERKKKLLKSIVQFRSDNIYDINHKIISNIIKFNKVILDDYKIIDDMNIKLANKIVNDLDFTNKTITIMKK